MKNRHITLLLFLMMLSICSFAQERHHREGSRQFKPTLKGTWQLCTFSPGQDGQPQLSLMPVLKIIGSDHEFQEIAIPSSGGCFIQKQGNIETTSDSTFVEHLMEMMPDSTQAEPIAYHYKLEGPMWPMIDYKEAGKQEATNELWIRVHPQRHDKGQPGQRPIGQARGNKGKVVKKQGNINVDKYNPFKDSKDEDSDFD